MQTSVSADGQLTVKNVVTVPAVNLALLTRLRDRLAALGFNEDSLRACQPGPSTDPWSLAASQPARDHSPFSTIVTLFWSGAPVDARLAEAALEPLVLGDLESAGLVETRDGLTHPLCLLRPADGLIVASDIPAPAADRVLGVVPASETLARLTVRRPAGRALDLGTGCGVQALLLARHSEMVISIDVNPRALAFAAFNAALNQSSNVDLREGSWFTPVEGERFDVIACNPPYVISPDTTFTYRDGGLPRDAVSRMVVCEAARHLAEGGVATILCNWIHDGAWADPLAGWVADSRCDALLLRYATLDPAGYAARWSNDLRVRAPHTFQATVRRWLDYYRAEGIEHIGLGAVILRRRERGPNWVRALDMAMGPTCASSDHVLRLFEAADFLESREGRDLPRHAFTLANGHRVDQTLTYTGGRYSVGPAIFRCLPGIGLEARVDARVLDVLLECDGRQPLRDLVTDAIARRGGAEEALGDVAQEAVRELVARGFMIPVPADKEGATVC